MTTEYYAVKFGNDNEVMTLEELARMYEDGNDGSDKRSFETWLDCIATPLADPRDTDMMRLIRMARNLQVLGSDWHMSGTIAKRRRATSGKSSESRDAWAHEVKPSNGCSTSTASNGKRASASC